MQARDEQPLLARAQLHVDTVTREKDERQRVFSNSGFFLFLAFEGEVRRISLLRSFSPQFRKIHPSNSHCVEEVGAAVPALEGLFCLCD